MQRKCKDRLKAGVGCKQAHEAGVGKQREWKEGESKGDKGVEGERLKEAARLGRSQIMKGLFCVCVSSGTVGI